MEKSTFLFFFAPFLPSNGALVPLFKNVKQCLHCVIPTSWESCSEHDAITVPIESDNDSEGKQNPSFIFILKEDQGEGAQPCSLDKVVDALCFACWQNFHKSAMEGKTFASLLLYLHVTIHN